MSNWYEAYLDNNALLSATIPGLMAAGFYHFARRDERLPNRVRIEPRRQRGRRRSG